ncbi:MAG: alpha/beta hydrolase [Ahrensia sp.]|nr:alpha/beta hydrolase [Ahrensia sp.]
MTMKGRFITVVYSRERDIVQRDEVPLRKAKRQYVDETVRWSRRVRSYRSANGRFKYFAVGESRGGATVTVIFIHGKNGNRFLGVNDWTFGGNFNRLQNLMARNGGVLLTPEFTDFKARGASDIAALIGEFRQRSPGTKLIVACGSMGAGVCWHLSEQKQVVALIDGMMLLGGHWNYDYFNTEAFSKHRIPLLFAHGGADSVYPAKKQADFFKTLLKRAPNYPARFIMFENGVHGTPIRMVDWRRELNWIMAQ